MRRTFALAALALALAPAPAAAHPIGFGLLTLREGDEGEGAEAELRLSGAPEEALGVRVRFPPACAPDGEPSVRVAPTGVDRRWRLGCARLEGPIALERLPAGLEVQLVVLRRGGEREGARLDARAPSHDLGAPPAGVFAAYLGLGVEHILFGPDHLLFVLGLVLLVWRTARTPRRRARDLLAAVTAFTLGHSLTLGLAALGLLALPIAAVEACIALSILALAVELGGSWEDAPTWTRRRPGLVAAAFGLLHGLGFASALEAVGLPRGALLEALLAFNLGVELGQLAFVGAALLALGLLARRVPAARLARLGAYAIGVPAAYWLLPRLATLG